MEPAASSPTLDLDRYAQLLAEMRPVLIETEEEHDRMLTLAETLMEKGANLGPEEEKLLAMAVLLIEVFERSIEEDEEEGEEEEPVAPPTPSQTLQRLITARGLELADVADFFGNPRLAQEVLDGQREITRGQAKALGQYFQVPAKLFLA